MADSGVEGKGKKVTGGYDILEKIAINGGGANAASFPAFMSQPSARVSVVQNIARTVAEPDVPPR